MVEFHDRRNGKHLEVHGGGFYTKPTTLPPRPPTLGRVDTNAPVSNRPTKPPPSPPPDPRSIKHLNAPVAAAAKKPDPFKRRGYGAP